MARLAQEQLDLAAKDAEEQKELHGIEPPPEVPRGEFAALQQLERTK